MNRTILIIFTIFMSAIISTHSSYDPTYFLHHTDVCAKQLKAIGNANITKVQHLIIAGCNPNQYIIGQTQLGLAALKSMERSRRWDDLMGVPNPLIPIIKLLLENGADPCKFNYRNETAYEYYMNYVVWYPNPEIKELLDVCN